jgi:hypothetical protein
MALPKGDQYYEAIQMPQVSFADADLKHAHAETDNFGLPVPYSGGFTVTFKMKTASNNWAVRCMVREVAELERRYKAITDFFAQRTFNYFIGAGYLSNGIRINGVFYPIIKMKWVEGESLSFYLSKHYNNHAKVQGLIYDFVNMVKEMNALGIAHGDLQHGNIIVKNSRLYLIDYDCMYLPALRGLTSNEIGHRNFQHPQRAASHFNEKIDRFSSIVIYLSLQAIFHKPALWQKYHNGENLILTSNDIESLSDSPVIRELKAIPELATLTERFIGICHLNFDKVPALTDFINGSFAYDKTNLSKITVKTSLYKVLNGKDATSILNYFGQKVEVIAKISNTFEGKTANGQPYGFLNVGEYPSQTFTFTLWKEGVQSLESAGINYASLKFKWVSVTGVISKYRDRMQIVIDNVSQIQVLSGETEAMNKLGEKTAPAIDVSTSNPSKTFNNKSTSIFGEVYENGTTGSTQKAAPAVKPIITPPPAVKKQTPATTAATTSTSTAASTSIKKSTSKSNSANDKRYVYKPSNRRSSNIGTSLVIIIGMTVHCAVAGALIGFGQTGGMIGGGVGLILGIAIALDC